MSITEKQKEALNLLRPQKTVDAKEKSSYKVKDEFFNKEVVAKIDGIPQSIVADWRRICLSGNHIVAIKGEALSKKEVEQFKATTGAFEYYVEKISKSK